MYMSISITDDLKDLNYDYQPLLALHVHDSLHGFLVVYLHCIIY